MRRIPISLCLLILTVAAAPAATQTAPASPLDGSAFAVKVTPDEAAMKKGEKVFDDVILFKNGMVAMSACVKKGFKPSTYTAEMTGDVWSFATEQTSQKHGKSNWTAEIKADGIKGRMVWTKPDGTVTNYGFEGRRGGR